MHISFIKKNTRSTRLFFTKLFVVFFVVFSFVSPTLVLGASDGSGSDEQGLAEYQAAQARLQSQYGDGTTNNGASGGTSSLSGLGGQAIGAVGTCSIGSILGRFISSAIGALVNTLIGKIKGFVTGIVDDLLTFTAVPTSDGKVQKNTAAQSVKTTGIGHAPITGLLDWVGNISLDSIMFCIVNEIMTYITESTIQWINSGFNGNPVFVQNMGAMFQNIGNRETSNFMREISNGTRQAIGQVERTAVNGIRNTAYRVADPFRKGIYNTLSGSAQDSYQTRSQPTLNPRLMQNYSSYTGGNWSSPGGGFGGLMEISRPENNQYGQNRYAQEELQKRIASAQQIQGSMVQDGTRSFAKCRTGAKLRADGSCDPKDLQVTTPAKAINDETGARQSMKYMRLSFAQNFDSVVTALVNQLVKIAINKAYEAVQN